ncbi:MAG: LacI family DNA-binding transcriptional regulator [Candidatus Omnitrophota bacterium]
MDVTLKKIAKEAGVSAGAVSRIINGTAAKIKISPATENRVMDIVRKLNYRPNFLARGLRSGKTGLIGAVMASALDRKQGIVLQGIQRYFEQEDYGIVVYATEYDPDREQRALEFMFGKKVEGTILVSTLNWSKKIRDYVGELERRGVRLVCMGVNLHPEITSPFVGHDDRMAGYLAASHLLKTGRRKIACITNTFNSNPIGILRLAGYKKALKEEGISFDEKLVFNCNPAEFSYFEWSYNAISRFLKSRRTCDAVFAHCDMCGFGVMRAVGDCGRRVPDDIAVISVGNEEFSEYSRPSLSSVDSNDYMLGQELAKTLRKMIKGEKVTSKLLKPNLIIRESSKGAPMKQ